MEQPGHDSREQEGGDRIAGEVGDDDGEQLALTKRLGGVADHLQRQDEQADADEDTADLAPVATLGGHEHDRAGSNADRHQEGEIKGQKLDDQRRADLGAAHCELARYAADDARAGEGTDQQGDGGGALEGDRQAGAGQHRQHRIAHGAAQFLFQHIAIGAFDTGAHHAGREQQQRDGAGKMDEDDPSRSPLYPRGSQPRRKAGLAAIGSERGGEDAHDKPLID